MIRNAAPIVKGTGKIELVLKVLDRVAFAALLLMGE